MLLFLGLAACIWVFGHALKASKSARVAAIVLLYLVISAAVLILPETSPVAGILGKPRDWVTLGVVIALFLAYRRGLAVIRSRIASQEAQGQEPAKKEADYTERYARHIILREIGGAGQKRLSEAKVLVIGAGGLGAPVIQYLAGAGVGTLGVIDGDVVDTSNLMRQVIHRTTGVGRPKVFSAADAAAELNPLVSFRPYHRNLSAEIAEDLFSEYDLIIEGSDDVETKYLANRAARKLGKPLIFGALSQWEGQISLFDPPDGPCYRCLFPEPSKPGQALSCAEGGVLGPLPGVVGATMAVEAVKYIARTGETLAGTLLIYDAAQGETRRIRIARNPNCPDCGTALAPVDAAN